MSDPWWMTGGSGKGPGRRLVNGEHGRRPAVGPGPASAIAGELRARRAGFAPDWLEPVEGDAGSAFLSLFADMVAIVGKRFDRLPDKALVEFYETAGVRPTPASPSHAIVRFTLAPAATSSVLVPAGFQVGAKPATGDGPMVVFETRDTLHVAPAAIDSAFVIQEGSPRAVSLDQGRPSRPVAMFGDDPKPGDALLIGLSGSAAPTDAITFGFTLASDDGPSRPASAGGFEAPAEGAGVLLSWECLIRGGFQPIELLRDETRGLAQSGLVELRAPAGWRPEVAVPASGAKPLWWVRARLIQGGFKTPPLVAALDLNVARARAVRTIRDEVPELISDAKPTRMRLAHSPVVPGSVMLDVTEPVGAADGSATRRWSEVDDLYTQPPDAQVFTLAPESGVLTFGDGTNGAAVPPGFRNVVARSYEVGGGKVGAVEAGAIDTLLNTAPFLSAVTNPDPAVGGFDAEVLSSVVLEAPEKIRARGRAVTIADYALLARSAEGAEVRRALAISASHPGYPGEAIPGVVNVIVIPPTKGDGPPVPDEAALLAVAEDLSARAAPADVEVVASAPNYLVIDTEIGFVADPAASLGETARLLIDAVNGYLHPLTGGDDGRGWPFGEPLVHATLLLRLITAVPAVRAISDLRLFVNGAPRPPCADVPLGVGELFWPRNHNVFPMPAEARS